MLPLVRLTCEYKTPIRYGETALVKTRLSRATKVRLVFGYEVYSMEKNVLCTTGTTEHAWTGANLKPVNIAKYKPELYEKLLPMYNSIVGEN